MTTGRHGQGKIRRQPQEDSSAATVSTLDTSPGQPLRTSLKGSAPQVYQRRPVRSTEALPMWVWMLFLLLATLFYFLSQG